MGTIPQEASQTGSLTAGASHAEEYEPRWNIVSWYEPESNSPQDGLTASETSGLTSNSHRRSFNTVVFFRKESRPQCFFAPEEERILFSPATVEMGGIGIVANRESFDRLTPARLRDIIREVADEIV